MSLQKVEYQLANLISDGERSNQGDGSQEEREEDTRDETRNYPNYLRRSGLEEDFESYPLIVALCWYSGIVRTTHAKNPYADILNVRFGFEFPIKKKVKDDYHLLLFNI